MGQLLYNDMITNKSCRFDTVDIDFMRWWVQLTPGVHLRAMLDARDFAVGAMRARVRYLYPELAPEDLGLKVLQEIIHAERAYASS